MSRARGSGEFPMHLEDDADGQVPSGLARAMETLRYCIEERWLIENYELSKEEVAVLERILCDLQATAEMRE